MQILDTEISYFNRCSQSDTPNGVTTLRRFLTVGNTETRERILQVRAEASKERRDLLKKQLPAATVSCTCTKRNTKQVIQHSGVVAFDIDFKDNTHIQNYHELREQLAKIVHVAYCGLSVSGTGYWGIIPIKHPNQHQKHFLALEEDFKSIGILIDPAPKSVVSLRIVSYDENAYINEKAVPYERLYERKKTVRSKSTGNRYPSSYSTTAPDIANQLSYIQANAIDLTSTYNDWVKVGFAIASEYGEQGREYFHAISEQHPEYNPADTDKQYDNILKAGSGTVTIATFFHLCKEHGVPIRKNRGYTGVSPTYKIYKRHSDTSKALRGQPTANELNTLQLPPGHKLETLEFPWGAVTNQINEHGYPAFWDN